MLSLQDLSPFLNQIRKIADVDARATATEKRLRETEEELKKERDRFNTYQQDVLKVLSRNDRETVIEHARFIQIVEFLNGFLAGLQPTTPEQEKSLTNLKRKSMKFL